MLSNTMYDMSMSIDKQSVLRDLRSTAPRKRKPIALRLPQELDEAVEAIKKQTGATYTAVIVKLVELGLSAFKGKS